jgi:hypothetical protein
MKAYGCGIKTYGRRLSSPWCGLGAINMKIAGFVPSEMRVEMVREMVRKMGIRPLSHSIGVNSKTVYKYKMGEAVPKDETLVRVLKVLRERDPEAFWGYMERLKGGFEEALLSLKEEGKAERQGSPQPGESLRPLEEGVELSRFEIYERLGIENPSERVRLARILSFLSSVKEFRMEELVDKVMLSSEEVEGYLKRMVQDGLLEKPEKGVYRVRVKCKL